MKPGCDSLSEMSKLRRRYEDWPARNAHGPANVGTETAQPAILLAVIRRRVADNPGSHGLNAYGIAESTSLEYFGNGDRPIRYRTLAVTRARAKAADLNRGRL